MGKKWDGDKGGRRQWVDWLQGIMCEVLRVLKPGAHGLVWSLPRTSHWTATALEDAGFEIREKHYHIYGSGFPKSHNISKAIDKKAGAVREVIGRYIPSIYPNPPREHIAFKSYVLTVLIIFGVFAGEYKFEDNKG